MTIKVKILVKLSPLKLGFLLNYAYVSSDFDPKAPKPCCIVSLSNPNPLEKSWLQAFFWFLSESPHPCEVWYNLVENIETWKNYRQTNMMVTKLNDGKRLHVLWLIYWLLVITSIDKYFMDIYDQYKYIQYINTIQI